MADHVYAVAGLRVVSDLPMPGLIAAPAPTDVARQADVTIGRATLPSPPAAGDDPLAEIGFEITGLMRMSMQRGSRLLYDPQPDAHGDDLALYLGGTGLGALLHQRGLVLLHASAVRIGNAAVLFCGPSGAGKSTLAAALVDAGHAHVADDFCAVDFASDGTPMVAPDGRRHKIWDSAISGLAMGDRRGGAVRTDMAKYYVDPLRISLDRVPIAAILELAVDEQTSISQLAAIDIVRLVQENAYRPGLVTQMGQQKLYFEAAVQLARTCRFGRLARALNYGSMAMQVAMIERLMADARG